MNLLEIETALQRHPAVEVAAARLRTPPLTGVTAFVSLVGPLCAHDADTVGTLETELLTLCRSRLLTVAVPARIMLLSEMPRTPAGKLDRKALPPDDVELPPPPEAKRKRVDDADEGDSPSCSAIIPQIVWAALEEALPGGGAAIGAEDDLFTHGITSVGAALIAFRLKVAMADIHQQRTPRRIATLLMSCPSTSTSPRASGADSIAKAAHHPDPSPQAAAPAAPAAEEEPSESLFSASSAATIRRSFSRAGGFHVHHHHPQDSGARQTADRVLDPPTLHADAVHGRRSLVTTWRAGLGKCIDASPLLVLAESPEWSVVAASHAGASNCPLHRTLDPNRTWFVPAAALSGFQNAKRREGGASGQRQRRANVDHAAARSRRGVPRRRSGR